MDCHGFEGPKPAMIAEIKVWIGPGLRYHVKIQDAQQTKFEKMKIRKFNFQMQIGNFYVSILRGSVPGSINAHREGIIISMDWSFS